MWLYCANLAIGYLYQFVAVPRLAGAIMDVMLSRSRQSIPAGTRGALESMGSSGE